MFCIINLASYLFRYEKWDFDDLQVNAEPRSSTRSGELKATEDLVVSTSYLPISSAILRISYFWCY